MVGSSLLTSLARVAAAASAEEQSTSSALEGVETTAASFCQKIRYRTMALATILAESLPPFKGQSTKGFHASSKRSSKNSPSISESTSQPFVPHSHLHGLGRGVHYGGSLAVGYQESNDVDRRAVVELPGDSRSKRGP